MSDIMEIRWKNHPSGGERTVVEDGTKFVRRVLDAEFYVRCALRRKIAKRPRRFLWFVIGYCAATWLPVLANWLASL